jgi:hypothetical protein
MEKARREQVSPDGGAASEVFCSTGMVHDGLPSSALSTNMAICQYPARRRKQGGRERERTKPGYQRNGAEHCGNGHPQLY